MTGTVTDLVNITANNVQFLPTKSFRFSWCWKGRKLETDGIIGS